MKVIKQSEFVSRPEFEKLKLFSDLAPGTVFRVLSENGCLFMKTFDVEVDYNAVGLETYGCYTFPSATEVLIVNCILVLLNV